jgi:steroid 5-alpha reductase family enzyme
MERNMTELNNNNHSNQPHQGKFFIFIAIATLLAALIAIAAGQGGARTSIAGLELTVVMFCAVVAFGVNWLIFLPSFLAQTEHYFDLTGGLTFITVALIALFQTPDIDYRSLLLAMLICIWALRLSSFLFLRVKQDGSDGRFDAIKPNFGRFMLTWTLQAFWVFVTSAAALAAITGGLRAPMDTVAWAGLAMWVIGMLIEMRADRQKRTFRKKPENDGRFITTGLWAWSRHPNYFGEIVLWLGVTLIALPVLSGWQYVTLVSPVFVVLLLTRVSGIPMLEARADKRWGHDAEYQAYKARTSLLIPRPPKG